ncbi:hypothetical protein BAE44_0015802 [Dichanthelium oligosanthes]|uniref:F-box domain-containing protein n=1 Tax=Dichanthelium oligosanthes TaxID=888268 RepID=A0A1E5VDJ1_9POAL|nr:hypothetical protein BAE44_0015802 [Dichanthelium oligosanthes]
MAGGSGSKKKTARRRRNRKPNRAAQLTDDLLVEILARVPYRSLCRSRCVSTRWRALISHPDHRARLPQTLAGIFYFAMLGSPDWTPPRYCFTRVPGTGLPFIHPSFSFLPDRERKRLVPVDCCNGLLLCRSHRFADDHEFDYLVLNPATEKWVAVPITRRCSGKVQMVRLGFDHAVSSHFYLFEFQVEIDDDDYDAAYGYVLGVEIYSSATGVWSHKQSGWRNEISLDPDFKSVFLEGMLYVNARKQVIPPLDVEGGNWRIIGCPRSNPPPFYSTAVGFIDLSQGQLHLANVDDMVGDKLAIWVLEDKDSEEWTLKHTVSFEHLVRTKHVYFGLHDFIVVAIHPDRNMVFFVFGIEKRLMSPPLDSGKVGIIHKL